MKELVNGCVGCNLCVKECAFLKKHGTPGRIANDFEAGRKDALISFECSLCGLCTSICPRDLDPCEAFFSMRSRVFSKKNKVLRKHRGILAYEKKGLSRRYSLYKIPEGCSTVFFPGCTFTGTRAGRTEQIYSWLRQEIPNAGLVFDCCTKPSHDLGREEFFNTSFSSLENFLVKNGVEKVITACPNCYKVFSTHSRKLKTLSIYEVLAEKSPIPGNKISGIVTIHDPCVTRFETKTHDHVRKLVKDQGLEIKEMEHSREKTTCCGEGGSVFSVAPFLAASWGEIRKKEAGETRVITYCAGCCTTLGKYVQTDHILDLIFEHEKTMNRSEKISRAPFTYLARINLKNRLKKENRKEIIEKKYPIKKGPSKKHPEKINLYTIIILIFIAALVTGLRLAGAD